MSTTPLQTPADVATEYATIAFIVQQLLSSVATATLVRVKACTNAGELSPVGTVDVQLLVDQVTGSGVTIPHGTVFKAPYMRIQGGSNAVVIDPEPGDIGVCVFASRDISSIKTDPAAARDRTPSPGAPPGSGRRFNLSDALYVGGMLNGTPTQFVQFTSDGITVKSPTSVTVEAPTINLKGDVVQTAGDVTMSGTLDVAGAITSPTQVQVGSITLTHHKHPTAPLGPVSEPIS